MNPHNFYSDVNIDGILLAKGITINGAYSLPILDGPANYVLATDGLGNITFQNPSILLDETLGLANLDDVNYPSGTPVDGDVLVYNGTSNQWEPTQLPLLFSVTASRNTLSRNLYLNQDDTPMNVSPFILPFDCKLKYLSASTDGAGTWTAEVHVNGVLVPGATLNIVATNKAKVKFFIPIQFNEDDEVMLYCNGTGVNKPRIIAFFG